MSLTIGKAFENSFSSIEKSYGNRRNSQAVKKDDKQEKVAKKNDISGTNEAKLSEKAQKFLQELREKYGDYDFFVGNSADDLKSLSKSGSKEFSVILTSAEIERMASDEEYANEQIEGIEGAVNMAVEICKENGFLRPGEEGEEGQFGRLNKLTISIGDDGVMKLFAELEKNSEKDNRNSVKRTTIEADSKEDFAAKLAALDWEKINASYSGDRFDFKA